jgi:hypothetical protein
VADLSDSVSPLQDAGMQIYNSFSGCMNHSALHGGDELLTHLSFRSPDPTGRTKTRMMVVVKKMFKKIRICIYCEIEANNICWQNEYDIE